MIKYKAYLTKGNKAIKVLFDVTKVNPNYKYGYFEITQHIYHHDIITIHRYKDFDSVIIKDQKDGSGQTTYYAREVQ